MLLKRSYHPEIMDDFSIKDSRVDGALHELVYINKFLGGINVTRAGLRCFVNDVLQQKHGKNESSSKGDSSLQANRSLSILDTGAGASDILLALNKNNQLDIYTLDKNIRACTYLKQNSDIKNIICGDITSIPVNKKFDIIHCSLFLHHFRNEELIKIISSFLKLADKGIIINDLRRSLLAYLGIKILTAFFSNSSMVKNDGPLSVKRGFIKKDLQDILDKAGCTDYIIKRKWAFRWLVVIRKNNSSGSGNNSVSTIFNKGRRADEERTLSGRKADFSPLPFLLPSGIPLYQDYDITVLGGGPAGSAVSYLLSKAGLKVCLIEKKEFPREVLCGEFLSHEVAQFIKKENMWDDFIACQPNEISRLSIHGNRNNIDSPLGFSGYGLRRSRFDNFLLKQSCNAGTTIMQPAEAVKVTNVNGIHELTIKINDSFKMITSTVVIAAYGKQNIIDKKLNRSFYNARTGLNGIKYHIPAELVNNFDENSISIFTAEGIYCGVNKVDNNYVTICWLEKQNGTAAKEKLKTLYDSNKFFRNIIPEPEKILHNYTVYGTGNIFFNKRNKVENGIFMCGDSAGVISPLAGDGVAMAIESAGILTQTLLKYFSRSINKQQASVEYTRKWNRTFNARLQMASFIQKILMDRILQKPGLTFLAQHPKLISHLITGTRA